MADVKDSVSRGSVSAARWINLAGDCQPAGRQRGNAAALEITLGQVDIQFERDCWFALTGAACEAMLDGEPVWVGWRMAAKAGQHLVLKTRSMGSAAIWRCRGH
jgi:allophanate hydrolase subunit 2